MSDNFDANGLTVQSFQDLVNGLTSAFKANYGQDINLNSNSPDAQILNILAQAGTDIRELIIALNAGFDPNQAVGITLDQRVAINNIIRNSGSFTIVPIDVTVNQTVTLNGLDTAINDPNGTGFTISDDAGNQYILANTTTFTSGTTSANFRAQNIGQVEVVANTINNINTIVLGVTSVNNSAGVLTQGTDTETDFELRTRRAASVSLNSKGSVDGLKALLLNLPGVTAVEIDENKSDDVNTNGTPAHGIWVIVEGGANSDIAQTIYSKHGMGSNMKGSVIVTVATATGENFIAKFDRPVANNLFIKFDLKKLYSSVQFNDSAIKTYIVDNLTYTVNEYAETSKITAVLKEAISSAGGGGVPINVTISSDGVNYTDFIAPPALNSEWTIISDNISVNVIS
jgi:Baseplate J-like protein